MLSWMLSWRRCVRPSPYQPQRVTGWDSSVEEEQEAGTVENQGGAEGDEQKSDLRVRRERWVYRVTDVTGGVKRWWGGGTEKPRRTGGFK